MIYIFLQWRSDFDRSGFWDWPSEWPRMDDMMPRVCEILDRLTSFQFFLRKFLKIFSMFKVITKEKC